MDENKPRKLVDWESIKPDWIAGVKTKTQLAVEYDVSRAAMNKHFSELGIERDATAAILAAAEALVTHDVVTPLVTAVTKRQEREIIEANAEMLANVIRSHRRDCGRLRSVVDVLLSKIEIILNETELFRQVGEICDKSKANKPDRINELYCKVIEMPMQTDTTKKLAETLKLLIELERKIFKLDTQDGTIESAARGAAEGAARAMLNFDDVKLLIDINH